MSRLNVRLTELEQSQLEKQSKFHKLSVSEYVRMHLFDPPAGSKINLLDLDIITNMQLEINNINSQIDTVAQHLAETQKSLTMILNTLFQFMAVDIGSDKAREIFTTIKNKMEDTKNGK